MKRDIYCAICDELKECSLVDGNTIYPHRKDLKNLKLWVCECGGYVGTHKNSKSYAPLGVIVDAKIKKARMKIHARIDPIWKCGKIKRRELYKKISKKYGQEFHTARIINMDQYSNAMRAIDSVLKNIK